MECIWMLTPEQVTCSGAPISSYDRRKSVLRGAMGRSSSNGVRHDGGARSPMTVPEGAIFM